MADVMRCAVMMLLYRRNRPRRWIGSALCNVAADGEEQALGGKDAQSRVDWQDGHYKADSFVARRNGLGLNFRFDDPLSVLEFWSH